MKKEVVPILCLLFLVQFASAGSIDDEIQKITYSAEEYEIGNINYIQLLLHASSAKQNLNKIMGATNREAGGLLEQEQLKSFLGESAEQTKWVWVEKEEREKRLDEEVPIWKTILYDGKKIQVRISAFPSLFMKENKESLIYRLNFEIDFKKPEEKMDVKSKINEIQSLAEEFNLNPSNENAENLAKESVKAEKTFEYYFRQSSENCEDLMKDIFGVENKRDDQKMIAQEIDFYSGENFEAIFRLEMCDECEWNWVNMNMRLEGRGPGFKPQKDTGSGMESMEEFRDNEFGWFEAETRELLEKIKAALEKGDYGSAYSYSNKLRAITEAWNNNANDVWGEIDKEFEEKRLALSPEDMMKINWEAEEIERKNREKELREESYEARKEFYLDLFSEYNKKEFYYTQKEYEKRLVEEFKEFGEEICDNDVDDNKNEKIDCSDDLCAGKICGTTEIDVEKGNETTKEIRDLFCISGFCQLVEIDEVVENEIVYSNCTMHDAIECNGNVVFSGEDEYGCPLEPVCIEEEGCETNEDCESLCGVSGCIDGACQVSELTECEQGCIDGDRMVIQCNSQELITEVCINSLWVETGVACDMPEEGFEETIVEKDMKMGYGCSVREDCGDENAVCSNGRCELIPEVIHIDEGEQIIEEGLGEEMIEEESEISEETIEPEPTEPENERESEHIEQETELESEQESNSEPEVSAPEPTPEVEPTGGAIFLFQKEPKENLLNLKFLINKITGKITGRIVEGEESGIATPEPTPEPNPEPAPEIIMEPEVMPGGIEPEEVINGESEPIENMIEPGNENYEIEQPAMFNEGEDEEEDYNEDFEEVNKIEKKEEKLQKEEKGVFTAGGVCRTAQQKTEGFIWFGGWGDPFEKIQNLKQKYYSGGEADWCKDELESLKKNREEFFKGFNQEFVTWFFEKYLANSANDWEQHVSGIFEIYWSNVDNLRQMAERMRCLEIQEFPSSDLISVEYETEYGKLKYWEELTMSKIPGFDEEVQIISPFMEVWIFPSKEIMIYEFGEAMKNHEFPGPQDESEGSEGPTDEEKVMIKQDEKFMEKIRGISAKYGGNLNAAIQVKDYETGGTVFNLYAQVNENDILKIEPMLPEEVPEQDVKVELDFEKIYDLIYTSEKEMRGSYIESPPWNRKPQPVIKNMINGVKMYLKVRSLVGSADVYPEESEKDVKKLFNIFFKMMSKGDEQQEGMEEKNGIEEDIWESKEEITGETVY